MITKEQIETASLKVMQHYNEVGLSGAVAQSAFEAGVEWAMNQPPDCGKMQLGHLTDRDLDALICEELLGWIEWETAADCTGDPATRSIILIQSPAWLKEIFDTGLTFPPKGKIGRAYLCPQFSYDLASALKFANEQGFLLNTPLPKPRKIVEMAFEYGLNKKGVV